MKAFVAIAFALVSNIVLANPAGQFIGRYTISPSANCAMGVDAERAYARLEDDAYGRRVLTIQSYGMESRITTIPVENGVAQSAGTRREDNVTDRTRVTWPTAQSMRVETVTNAPSMGIRYTTTFTVTRRGNRVTIRETVSNAQDRNSTCVLIKR